MKVTIPEGFTEQDDLKSLLRHITIESNIPEGSGLGSSAALSVSLAQCFTNHKQKIFELAKKFEDEFHSGSSGLDVFTSANGGLCSLSSRTTFEKLPEILLMKLKKFRFSVIDTKERRKVSEIKSKLSQKDLEEFLPEASMISKEFEDFLHSETQEISKIVSLFDKSQKALIKLKVSTTLIDSIIIKLKEEFNNDLGIKITGAGGGGCLLLVHNERVTEELILNLVFNSNFNINLYYNIEI